MGEATGSEEGTNEARGSRNGDAGWKTVTRHRWVWEGIEYEARPPLRFEIREDEDGMWQLRGEMGTESGAESQEEALESVDETIEMLWETYAQERPERLAPDAQDLRARLMARIRRAT